MCMMALLVVGSGVPPKPLDNAGLEAVVGTGCCTRQCVVETQWVHNESGTIYYYFFTNQTAKTCESTSASQGIVHDTPDSITRKRTTEGGAECSMQTGQWSSPSSTEFKPVVEETPEVRYKCI